MPKLTLPPFQGDDTRRLVSDLNRAFIVVLRNISSVFAYMIFHPQDTTPNNPTEAEKAHVYLKGEKLIIQYDDAGTVRYKYLLLTGTGVTWVHTTSAP